MSDKLTFDFNKILSRDRPTFIIAEIGQNHQGDVDLAKRLIKTAKECGADCVKFQKTSLPDKFTKTALDRPYNSPNSFGPTYGAHKQHLEFSAEDFKELQNFAKRANIFFTASAMDTESLKFLASLEVPFIKIGSGDVNNVILIEKAAATGIPLVISTGMSDFENVKLIYRTVKKYHSNFALLHCVSSYPTQPHDVHLNVLNLYKTAFPDIPLGYSGHELGTNISQAAVCLGAKIIERHFTLDKTFKGSDHQCSLEPQEFLQLVKNIREIESAFGVAHKDFQQCEKECYGKLGKTIVAAGRLEKGTVLQQDNLKIKVCEPKGIDGKFFNSIVGKVLAVELLEDDPVSYDCLD